MPSPQPENISAQLHRVRRLVIWGGGGALAIVAATLAFVPYDERVVATGTIGAEDDIHLHAPADGILGPVAAREGDRVTAGQPVARLDDTAWREKLRQLEAQIAQAQNNLARAKASKEATAGLPLPKEFWHTQDELALAGERVRYEERNLARVAELHARGGISRQDLEAARLALDAARTEEKKTSDRLALVRGGLTEKVLAEAAAGIGQAYSARQTLEVERDIVLAAIERCIVRAPRDGIVTLVTRSRPGTRINRGDDLAHLSRGEPSRVEMLCGESQYHRIRPGQRVLMRSNAFDPLRHGYIEGTVLRAGLEPEKENRDAPRYRVVAAIDRTPQPLVLGSTVEARIIIRRASLWRLLFPAPANG